MKIAITGHRPNKLGNDYTGTSPLLTALRAKIIEAIMLNCNKPDELTLITGMALGIDQLFAEIAISMQFPFIAAIPCWNQDKMWTIQSKEQYGNILANKLCTIYLVLAEEYTAKCMQIRNQWMVDNCDLLIAVWDGTNGGTANCIRYATSKNKEIIRINPKEIKLTTI